MTLIGEEPQALKPLYNPDTEDFVWEYLDENNSKHEARVPAMTVMLFPAWLTDLITTHLTDHLYFKRGQKLNPEADKAEIRREILNVKIYDTP